MPRRRNAKPTQPVHRKPRILPAAANDAKNPARATPGSCATEKKAARNPSANPPPIPPKRHRRSKHVPLAEAMRVHGLDEHKVAQRMSGLIDDLGTGDKEERKLLLDALKECSRRLEEENVGCKPAASDAPVPVQLIHYVSRPERESNSQDRK